MGKLYDEVKKALSPFLQRPAGSSWIQVVNPEPSAVERLAALVDDEVKARIEDWEADQKAGRLRVNVAIKPHLAAEITTVDFFMVEPNQNANEEALDE